MWGSLPGQEGETAGSLYLFCRLGSGQIFLSKQKGSPRETQNLKHSGSRGNHQNLRLEGQMRLIPTVTRDPERERGGACGSSGSTKTESKQLGRNYFLCPLLTIHESPSPSSHAHLPPSDPTKTVVLLNMLTGRRANWQARRKR